MKNAINKIAGAALAFGVMGVATQAAAADSADKGKLILNEYNAVGPSAQLEDCDQNPEEGDIFFDCRNGNGSNWVEFVVTGDNLNIQGWTVYWENDDSNVHGGHGYFTFSNHAVWSNLRAGTIITVRDDGSTATNDHAQTAGTYDPCNNQDWWIGVSARSTTYISAAVIQATTPVTGFKTDNDAWAVRIDDDNGDVVLGWVGEGVAKPTGVGSDEVAKLEQNPVFGIDASNGTYNDGDCSTYGGPNCHTGGDAGGGWYQSLNTLCNASCGGSSACCSGGANDYSCWAANVNPQYGYYP